MKMTYVAFCRFVRRGRQRSIADSMSFESMEEDTLLLPRLARKRKRATLYVDYTQFPSINTR
jgi:hypothetical protein